MKTVCLAICLLILYVGVYSTAIPDVLSPDKKDPGASRGRQWPQLRSFL